MSDISRDPVHPNLIAAASVPHFLLAGLVAAFNWRRLGYQDKAASTVKWSLIGTAAEILFALYIVYFFSLDILIRIWSVGLGINLGAGMALRTIQLPEYNKRVSARNK